MMQKTCRELVEEAREAKVSNRVATRNIEDLGDGSQVGVFWLEKTEMFFFSSACPFGFQSELCSNEVTLVASIPPENCWATNDLFGRMLV